MSRSVASLWIPLLGLAVAACAATGGATTGGGGAGAAGAAGPSGTGGSGASTTGGSGGTGGETLLDAGGGGGGGTPACDKPTTLMYLLGQAKELYSFDPANTLLNPIGVLNCPSGFAAPFSMSVDRTGTAWVLFDDGKLYKVKTSDATCTLTGYLPGQQGFSTFGMGFVSDQAGGDTETLYVTEADIFGNGSKLAKLDTATLKLTVIGTYDTIVGGADATGTGDGKLYGFFRTSPVAVAQIDKASAMTTLVGNPAVTIGSAWAFAFWGGSFWLFTKPGFTGSQLDKFDPTTGLTSNVSTNIGFTVVGAGVSTCAPTEPPS